MTDTASAARYEYTDHSGDHVEVWPSADDCDGASIEVNGELAHVPAAEMPELAAVITAIRREDRQEQLNRIYSAVDYMTNLDGQDHGLVIEMSQAMLNDIIEGRDLAPMVEYVRRFCDVIDSADDAERIAADI
jgi:hypothetical protein